VGGDAGRELTHPGKRPQTHTSAPFPDTRIPSIFITTEYDTIREEMYALITVDILAKAIRNKFDHRGMDEESARSMAHHVMNFFGFNDRIIDNILEPEDRDVFYMLEDAGLLTTEREETALYDGREWRIHYWILDSTEILMAAKSYRPQEIKQEDEGYQVYDDIPDDIWKVRPQEQ